MLRHWTQRLDFRKILNFHWAINLFSKLNFSNRERSAFPSVSSSFISREFCFDSLGGRPRLFKRLPGACFFFWSRICHSVPWPTWQKFFSLRFFILLFAWFVVCFPFLVLDEGRFYLLENMGSGSSIFSVSSWGCLDRVVYAFAFGLVFILPLRVFLMIWCKPLSLISYCFVSLRWIWLFITTMLMALLDCPFFLRSTWFCRRCMLHTLPLFPRVWVLVYKKFSSLNLENYIL